MDAAGKPLSEITTVLAGNGRIQYEELRVTRDPQTGNLILMVSRFSKGVGSILGYTLNADGILLRKKPIQFAAKKMPAANYLSGFFSVPDGEFDDKGHGMTTWGRNENEDDWSPKINIRRLIGNGAFSSDPKIIAQAGNLGSSIVFDSGNNLFLVLWDGGGSGFGNNATGALLDPITGAVMKGPFRVADSFPGGLDGAYEKSSGTILIVWTDSCYDIFPCSDSFDSYSQVQAAIFSSN